MFLPTYSRISQIKNIFITATNIQLICNINQTIIALSINFLTFKINHMVVARQR